MAFTPTPVDGSTPTPIPMSSAVPDGTNTPLALEGGPAKATGGNTLAPAAVYQYDGYNETMGLKADVAVTGDTSGTLSGKIRGFVKILTDVWDSVNHRLHVNVDAGSITANAGSGTFNNQQSNVQSDYDSGAGTQNVTMQGIALPASGGAVPGGTSTNPVRIDPTGATIQPVSGTVTANAGTNLNTSGLAIEAGGHLAAVDTAQGATTDVAVVGDNPGTLLGKMRGLTKIFNDVWDSVNHRLHVNVDNVNANGQTTMSASAPVVVASDQTPVAVKGNAAAGAAVPANPVYVGMQAFSSILRPLTSALSNNALSTDTILATLPYALTNPSGFTADLLRHPSIWKTATATAAGNTAVWTPTTGLKFRIMRYRIEVTANAAQSVAGVITLQFQDSATATPFSHSVFVPGTAGTTMGQGYVSPWIDLGNGFLSATANNVLNVNLSTALTAGNVRVVVVGTEE